MLINLSNHSSNIWSDFQIISAKKLYGKVVDIDFPQIPPDADEVLVIELAKDYLDICIDVLSTSKDKTNAVHLMGEMTFVYNLVALLKNKKITCIASTTDRNSIESSDSKITFFNFIRFREY